MYPEGEGAGAPPAADYGYDSGMKSKLTRNLEGLIPLILIIIIVAFLGHKFGFWNIPFLGGEDKVQMLVIGMPSADMLVMLNQDEDLVYYRVKDASDLDISPKEQLAQYDVILLDQHLGGPRDKAISRELGEAIENFVRTGGKLVTVLDSGIYRSGGLYGEGIATDIIGWKANFGDTIPIECDRGLNDVPTCTYPLYITGRVQRVDYDHKVMEGIDMAPADPMAAPISALVFRVKPVGNIIAQFKNEANQSSVPAIVEKRLIIGKSIYFNYDPALTPGIWQKTLEYLR